MGLYCMLAEFLSESAGLPKSSKLYHLSEKNLDGVTLTPRIPSNSLTQRGLEENKTPRVSMSTSIQGALVGISNNLKDKEFYIHIPAEAVEYYSPTIAEVPDVKCSHEVWVKKPVKLKLYKKIVVTSAQDNPLHYKLGDDDIETYKWNYDYIPI